MNKRSRRWLQLMPARLVGAGIYAATAALGFVMAWKAAGYLEFGFVGLLVAVPLGAIFVTRWLLFLTSSRPNPTRYRIVLWGAAVVVLGVLLMAFQMGAHEASKPAPMDPLFESPER